LPLADRSTRRTTPRTTIVLVLALTAAALAAVVWTWRTWHVRTPTLERQWTASVRVVGGDGTAGTRDGDPYRAQFSDPFGVAIGQDGTIYVADGAASSIRAIAPDGRIRTLAGGERGFADGVGAAARFDTPSALAIDAAGTLYVADTGNNAIRRISRDAVVSTLAGDGVAGFRDGPAAEARFNGPVGLTVDATGRVIVADTYNDRIRVIAPEGTVRTLAGSGAPGAIDGVAVGARFDTPSGVAVDLRLRVYVADTGNDIIRRIEPDGVVSTLMAPLPDGFVRPLGIAISAHDVIYTTDARGRVIEIQPDGAARTLAGATPGFADGVGQEARLRMPAGIAIAEPGRVIVADAGNSLVRVAADSSRLDLRAPASSRIAPRFDPDGFGFTPLLWPVAPMEGPHEIAGTLGEARGAEGAERFHTGIDVRREEGATVLAVRDGVVLHPLSAGDFGSLNESLRVGPLSYVHIRAGRALDNQVIDPDRFVPTYDESGKLVGMRVKRGARFASGEALGSVNGFNHVHLNVGWPGEEYNPLGFHLVHFEDSVPPTIARGGIRVFDELGQPVTRRVGGRVALSGRVHIIVDAWDQVDGNRPGRRLGLYDLGYQILRRDGSPAPGFEAVRHALRFDRLASDPDAARLAYAPGSGIPFYRGRRTRFLYAVTNTLRGGVASPGAWDTTLLEPGDYIVRVLASDVRGNTAVANRDLPVTVQALKQP
jgi:sugar lactone lactonase YvrE